MDLTGAFFLAALKLKASADGWLVECEYRLDVLPHGSWSLKGGFHIGEDAESRSLHCAVYSEKVWTLGVDVHRQRLETQVRSMKVHFDGIVKWGSG